MGTHLQGVADGTAAQAERKGRPQQGRTKA